MTEDSKKSNLLQLFLWVVIVALCGVGLYYYNQWRYPPQHWEDIQAAGGMKIGLMLQKDNMTLLPVKYDITGQEAVTRQPTRKDKGLMIEDVKAQLENGTIVLTIVGSQATLITDRPDIHYAKLNGIPAGKYDVYYETAGDPQKRLGTVDVP